MTRDFYGPATFSRVTYNVLRVTLHAIEFTFSRFTIISHPKADRSAYVVLRCSNISPGPIDEEAQKLAETNLGHTPTTNYLSDHIVPSK